MLCYHFNNVDYEINYIKGRRGPSGPQGYKGQKGDAYFSAVKGEICLQSHFILIDCLSFVILQHCVVSMYFWTTS